MKNLLIGKLGKCFGLKGEVRLILLTSFPELRFCKGRKLSISNGKEAVEATVKALRLTEKGYLISFEEMPSINEVEPYVGFSLFMDKKEAPLPEGNYRYGDLIGMEVFSKFGESLGKVKDVLDYAPKKTLRVEREGKTDFFVPFVDEFVLDIDVENKKMTIRVIPGLL